MEEGACGCLTPRAPRRTKSTETRGTCGPNEVSLTSAFPLPDSQYPQKDVVSSISIRVFLRSALLKMDLWLPWWLSGKESICQSRRHGFDL